MKNSKPGQYILFSPDQIKPAVEWVDYFIQISPPESIANHIKTLKKKIQALDLDCESLEDIAHISILKAKTTDKNFPAIAQKILTGQKAFNIKLLGSGILEIGTKKTLLLKLENPEPIQSLYRMLTGKSDKHFQPHLAIAKNLSPDGFSKIESVLPEFDYTANWLCESVAILKKPFGGKHYKLEREILFGAK